MSHQITQTVSAHFPFNLYIICISIDNQLKHSFLLFIIQLCPHEFDSIYHAQMIFNRHYEWYNNHRKHGELGRKSPEQYLRENDLISGPYKTEKISDIVSNFNAILSKN